MTRAIMVNNKVTKKTTSEIMVIHITTFGNWIFISQVILHELRKYSPLRLIKHRQRLTYNT